MYDKEWFEYFPKLLNSPKAPKVGGHFGHLQSVLKQRVFSKYCSWTAKDKAQSNCQIRQYAQDFDPEVHQKIITKFDVKDPEIRLIWTLSSVIVHNHSCLKIL